MNNTIRDIDLTDEWAQRFRREIQAALDAADRKDTVEGDPSWLHEDES